MFLFYELRPILTITAEIESNISAAFRSYISSIKSRYLSSGCPDSVYTHHLLLHREKMCFIEIYREALRGLDVLHDIGIEATERIWSLETCYVPDGIVTYSDSAALFCTIHCASLNKALYSLLFNSDGSIDLIKSYRLSSRPSFFDYRSTILLPTFLIALFKSDLKPSYIIILLLCRTGSTDSSSLQLLMYAAMCRGFSHHLDIRAAIPYR